MFRQVNSAKTKQEVECYWYKLFASCYFEFSTVSIVTLLLFIGKKDGKRSKKEGHDNKWLFWCRCCTMKELISSWYMHTDNNNSLFCSFFTFLQLSLLLLYIYLCTCTLFVYYVETFCFCGGSVIMICPLFKK